MLRRLRNMVAWPNVAPQLPPARSTRMTSAPMSASIMPAKGPGPIPASSMMRMPASGPAMSRSSRVVLP